MSTKTKFNGGLFNASVSWRVKNINIRKHDMPAFILSSSNYYSWKKHAKRAYVEFPSIISDFNKYKLEWCEVTDDNKKMVASKSRRMKLIYPKTTLSPVTIKN